MKTHPVFSRFYRMLVKVAEPAEREHRARTAGGASGRVLEIGAGTGAMLPHYPPEARLVLLEPEPSMAGELRRAVARSGRPAVIVRGSAEALPFRDGIFDTVVASLVLCSVAEAAAAAGEIRRVLARGGALRFFEHVRSADPSFARKQDRWDRMWGRFSGGCHPNRDTVATLRAGGFVVEHDDWIMPRAWLAGPHTVGEARPE
jgi:ubiquinone/menaquinone biosynthesis C-methylase UbiE